MLYFCCVWCKTALKLICVPSSFPSLFLTQCYSPIIFFSLKNTSRECFTPNSFILYFASDQLFIAHSQGLSVNNNIFYSFDYIFKRGQEKQTTQETELYNNCDIAWGCSRGGVKINISSSAWKSKSPNGLSPHLLSLLLIEVFFVYSSIKS